MLTSFILNLFRYFSRSDIKESIPEELICYPLDYLIGTDKPPTGNLYRIMEVGYDVDRLPRVGISIAYCNLFDEKNTGRFSPYMPPGDTASEYREGQINPHGSGWKKNLSLQFARRKDAGFHYIELDNPDAYDTDDVIGAINFAQDYGLRVIAKNANICKPDPEAYLRHKNVYGLIVEKGAGTPVSVDLLRRDAGKPDLPVWFVFFGSTRLIAEETARIIKQKDLKNMGVTYSAKGEYGSSEDVFLPIRG